MVTRNVTVRDVLRIFWQHTRPFKGRAFLLLLLVSAATVADALQPWFLKQLFDRFEHATVGEVGIDLFLPVFLGLLGLRIAGWLLWRIMGFVNNRFQPKVMASLEQHAFSYLLDHSYQFFADNFAGSLSRKIYRLTRAFETLADDILFQFVPVVVVIFGGVVGLYLQQPVLAGIFAIWAVIFLCLNYLAARWAVKLDVERSAIDSEMGGAVNDAISNAITIKLFPAPDYELKRLTEVIQRFVKAQILSWDRHEQIIAGQALLTITLQLGFLYFGIMGWIRGQLTLGDLAFIQTYLGFVVAKLWEIGRSFRRLFDSFAESKEMVEILHLPHAISDKRGAKTLRVNKAEIVFRRVGFGFDQRSVLEDFSLTVAPGERVAFVGPSGAGKSTITKLLFRFYNLDKGEILIDGQNIAKVTQESLREQISLVPQDPSLFHRTLMENIRYGQRSATDAQVIAAAKLAHCHEFITELPQGYDTFVGERGIKLSGGERQRVAIARAILKNAPILVLDEATSSLDSESESLVQDALHELMKDKTVIVIAHRLSTIMEMDRIVVIEDGRISSEGSHDDLIKQTGTYKKLWNIQVGGFAK